VRRFELKRNSAKAIVILPAYNEEKALARTISELVKVLPKSEIVVIDNASTDGTASIAKKASVTLLYEPRKGKGFAVQRGFDYAISKEADVIALLDADSTYGVERLEEAVQLVAYGGVDIVVGTRVVASRSEETPNREHFRFGHIFGNKFFGFISKALFPTGIEDVLSGFRVMSRPFVFSFPREGKGFEIEALLNSHTFNLGAKVFNLRVNYYARPDGSHSKLSTYGDGFRILRTNLRNFRNDRPSIAFGTLAVPWFLATVFFVYLPFSTYFQFGEVPNLPRLVTGIGTFFIACLLWVAGIILERVRQVRVLLALNAYGLSRRF
jgi:glycosyltransferase involved in cell wall biosynthesis